MTSPTRHPEERHVLCVVGTRPEAIKMAPVILRLRRTGWARVSVVATAQHRAMLDQVLGLFGIVPDADLDIMRPNQSLVDLTARLLPAFDAVLERLRPDLVLAQGDTTTVFIAGLGSFYRHLPFGHVEAGLRTFNLASPFPEEMNRVLVSRLSALHFAPTGEAQRNLIREGVAAETVLVTGNTVIDALQDVAERDIDIGVPLDPDRRLILLTAHRRENFGPPMRGVFTAVRELIEANPDVTLLYPVHPNPNVGALAEEIFRGHPRIVLTEPLDYGRFVAAMKRSHLILTDSGGVQEEAPALGKPVLVLRNDTERPEAVREGLAALVGTDPAAIRRTAQALLDDPAAYRAMAKGYSPYGDGHAADRIVARIARMWDGGPAERCAEPAQPVLAGT